MALKYGNTAVQNYIFNCGKKHTVSHYKVNNNLVWSGYIPTDSKYFTFVKFGGVYVITGVDVENIPAEVVLPSTYEGLPVSMCNADFGERITSLVITSPVVLGNCFNNSTNLANITFTTDEVHLGAGTFLNTAYYNDESNWVDDILYIGKHLIVAKETISDVNIRSETVNIADGAFRDCTNISHITIPDGVRTVQGGFNENLETIIIPDSVTTINDSAFYGCKNITIYCEASSKPSGWASNWDYSSSNLTVVWGLLDDKQLKFTELADGTYSVKAKDVTTLPSVIAIPWEYNGRAVTAIGDYAFYACTDITEVTIPNSITAIGMYAFFANRLASVVIPSSVTTMGEKAFGTNYDNQNLTIYCEAASKPSGWASDWNKSYSGYSTVNWGYTS